MLSLSLVCLDAGGGGPGDEGQCLGRGASDAATEVRGAGSCGNSGKIDRARGIWPLRDKHHRNGTGDGQNATDGPQWGGKRGAAPA